MANRPMNRNGRGLFVGILLGGALGFYLGRFSGSPALGAVLGATVVGLLMYRLNPGGDK